LSKALTDGFYLLSLWPQRPSRYERYQHGAVYRRDVGLVDYFYGHSAFDFS
jgi:hypothetical protein